MWLSLAGLPRIVKSQGFVVKSHNSVNTTRCHVKSWFMIQFLYLSFCGKDPGLFSPVILMNRKHNSNNQTAKDVMSRLLRWQNSIFQTCQLKKLWHFIIFSLIFTDHFITENISYFICFIFYFTINPLKYDKNILVFPVRQGMFIFIMVGQTATIIKRVISRPKLRKC